MKEYDIKNKEAYKKYTELLRRIVGDDDFSSVEALMLCDQIINLEKEEIIDPSFYHQYASALDAVGRKEEAKQVLIKAIELNNRYRVFESNPPQYHDVNRMLGGYALDNENYEEAKNYYKRALEYYFDPDDRRCQAMKEMIRRIEAAEAAGENYDPNKTYNPSQKQGCFIATAVIGSPLSEEVKILSQYRDEVLYKSVFGRFFIRLYYTVSPSMAACITHHPVLRRFLASCLIIPLSRTLRLIFLRQY